MYNFTDFEFRTTMYVQSSQNYDLSALLVVINSTPPTLSFCPSPPKYKIGARHSSRTETTESPIELNENSQRKVYMAPVDHYEARDEDRSINITLEWAKQILGMILIAEFWTTFLCGCCASSLTTWFGSGCAGKISFLSSVAWTAFVNILITILIRVLGLWERLLWLVRHPMFRTSLCGLAVFAFLVASSLVASCTDYVYNGGTAVAAAIFGFVSLVLFAVDGFLHFRRYRNMETEGRRQTEEQGKADIAVI